MKRTPPSPAKYSPSFRAGISPNNAPLKRHDNRISPATAGMKSRGPSCPIESHMAFRGSASTSRNPNRSARLSSNQKGFLSALGGGVKKKNNNNSNNNNNKKKTSMEPPKMPLRRRVRINSRPKGKNTTATANRPIKALPVNNNNITSDSMVIDNDNDITTDKIAQSKARATSPILVTTNNNNMMSSSDKVQAAMATLDQSSSARGPQRRRPTPKWTKEEDRRLKEAVKNFGPKKWKKIAEYIGNDRTDTQALHRWNKVLKPGLVKGPWTPVEDKIVEDFVNMHGIDNVVWSELAEHLDGRSGKQCRERYFNHLDPSIKKGNWTEDEDRIIFEGERRIGHKWSEIAKLLPGRTENAVKNRWYSSARKKWYEVHQMDPHKISPKPSSGLKNNQFSTQNSDSDDNTSDISSTGSKDGERKKNINQYSSKQRQTKQQQSQQQQQRLQQQQQQGMKKEQQLKQQQQQMNPMAFQAMMMQAWMGQMMAAQAMQQKKNGDNKNSSQGNNKASSNNNGNKNNQSSNNTNKNNKNGTIKSPMNPNMMNPMMMMMMQQQRMMQMQQAQQRQQQQQQQGGGKKNGNPSSNTNRTKQRLLVPAGMPKMPFFPMMPNPNMMNKNIKPNTQSGNNRNKTAAVQKVKKGNNNKNNNNNNNANNNNNKGKKPKARRRKGKPKLGLPKNMGQMRIPSPIQSPTKYGDMMDIFGDGEMDMDTYALMNEKLISPTGHNYNNKPKSSTDLFGGTDDGFMDDIASLNLENEQFSKIEDNFELADDFIQNQGGNFSDMQQQPGSKEFLEENENNSFSLLDEFDSLDMDAALELDAQPRKAGNSLRKPKLKIGTSGSNRVPRHNAQTANAFNIPDEASPWTQSANWIMKNNDGEDGDLSSISDFGGSDR